MKQIHLNILLPVALLVSLAAAAAVFIVPLPFLKPPTPPEPTGAPPPGSANSSIEDDLPDLTAQDWTAVVERLEGVRIPSAAGAVTPDAAVVEAPVIEQPKTGAQSMLDGLPWAYVGNIIEPARVVACVEMNGKQAWLVEGQTTAATAGQEPFDVIIKAVSAQEVTIEYENASRTIPITTTQTAESDFGLAT